MFEAFEHLRIVTRQLTIVNNNQPMRHKVNIKKAGEGYSIRVPGLPGCWSEGQTEEESPENIKDAIQDYLETVDELGKDKESRYVEVC